MDSIIGHKNEIKKLEQIIENNKISNAYIFEGIKGIGKAKIAKKFATDIMHDANYLLIEPEDGVIKVDTIRKLREELMLKPITSERKVAIINDAECMNEQAQNSLLKILEEPPTYVTIILITSNKEKLLYTIKSRCVGFKFSPLSDEDLQEYFKNTIDKELLEYGMGSIGNILKAQNNDSTEIISRWVRAFNQSSLISLMKDINSIKEEKYVKENIEDFLEYLLYSYHNELKQGNYSASDAIQIVEQTRSNISRNANVDIALDRMSIDLWKWRKTCKKSLE